MLALVGLVAILLVSAGQGQDARKKAIDDLYQKAAALSQQGKVEEAIVAGNQLVTLGRDYFGPDHPAIAVFTTNLATYYFTNHQYPEADRFYREALAIFEKTEEPQSPSILRAVSTIGLVNGVLGRHEEALKFFQRELAITEQVYGRESKETAQAMDNVATMYLADGRHEEALTIYPDLLALRRRLLGNDSSGTLTTMKNLATCYQRVGRYSEALDLFGEVVSIHEEAGEDRPVQVAFALNSVGSLMLEMGKIKEAEEQMLRALGILEESVGARHERTAVMMMNTAVFYNQVGRYDESEAMFLRALDVFRADPGDGLSLVRCLSNLASLYHSLGRGSEAEKGFLEAVQVHASIYGKDHPEIRITLGNLAALYRDMGRVVDSLEYYRRALGGVEVPKLDSENAHIFSNMAVLMQTMERYEEAKRMFQSVADFQRETYGEDSLQLAVELRKLGDLESDLGNGETARNHFLRSFAIHRELLGEGHPDTIATAKSLALAHHEVGEKNEAVEIAKLIVRENSSRWDRVLRYFSERELLAFQGKENVMQVPGTIGDGLIAAEAQIRFKGAVLEAIARRKVSEAILKNTPEGQVLLEDRDRISRLYQTALLKGKNENGILERIQKEAEEVSKKVAAALKEAGVFAEAEDTSLAEVQGALDADTVLVEIFEYPHALKRYAWKDGKGKKWEDRLAAVVIHADGPPVSVELGDADRIDELVLQYRNHLAADEGGPKGEAAGFAAAERELYEKVISPLETHFAGKGRIVFSLDGQLQFVPLSLLSNGEGQRLGLEREVRYVASGRDLVTPGPERTMDGEAKGSVLLVGNPSFRDNAPLVALSETSADESGYGGTVMRSGGALQLSPLPGTAVEVSRLEEQFSGAGYEVDTLTREDAVEEGLVKKAQGRRVLHLATHGFFLEKVEPDPAGDPGENRGGVAAIENPMYRGGLALSGAQSTFNLWKNGQVPPPDRDGVLLAAEMAALDLRSADLVVLSACETAAGESLEGEGVMGIRRALYSAGAQNILMTLWPVNDESTVEVMTAFYEKYLGGVSPSRALAEVQRELLPSWIEKYGEIEAMSRLAPFICSSVGGVE